MIASSRKTPDENEKKAFVRDIEAKLAEKQERLSFIKRRVRQATEANRIQGSEQLQRAQLHADSSLKGLRAQLERLDKADNESWDAKRFDVEVAWDELSQAIKKVISRFP